MHNYTTFIRLHASADKVYNALTQEIPLWWTEQFEGFSHIENKLFTVRFGPHVHKTLRVKKLTLCSEIIWEVTDSLIDIPELSNQTEWIGTTIIWNISHKGTNTELQLIHIGLIPETECYDICSDGWRQFTESLKSYIENGKGIPYKI